MLGLLESEEGIHNATDVFCGQLAVLLAQIFSQGLVPLRGIDELHPAFAVGGLAVGEHPDVGGNAGVVKHIERQGDNRLEPVVFDDPAPNIALALASIACKEGGTVMHLGNAAAQRGVVLHLGEHIHQKQHLPVAGAGKEGELFASVLHDKARILDAVFAA